MDQTLFCDAALLPDGWARRVRLSWRDGVFVAVAAGVRAAADEARTALAVPGLGNVHSHAFQRAMAGLAERRGAGEDSFWTWREVMYRFLARLGPDDVAAVAAQAYAEMLETGFTRVGEFHYLHHDPAGRPYANLAAMAEAVVAGACASGIGLTLLPCFYAQGGFDAAPPSPGQARFLTTPDGFAALLAASRQALRAVPGAVLGVAPHSLRAVTEAQLRAVLALRGAGPVHIHAAEQVAEVEACLAATGQRPVEWLLNQGFIDAAWCVVHATHMTRAETLALAGTGATAGFCPITEASLGDGVAPVPEFLASGGRFGIGTDSNVQIDAAGELRQLEYAQRLALRRRNVLAGAAASSTGMRLFQAALDGGARALGSGPAGFVAGAVADIVTLDATHPALVGKTEDEVLDSLIFGASRPVVAEVWCRGRQRVRGGRHVDGEAIGAAYARALRRLLT